MRAVAFARTRVRATRARHEIIDADERMRAMRSIQRAPPQPLPQCRARYYNIIIYYALLCCRAR